MLAQRHILVGISGGIAAYKIPELIRLLIKAGADVQVVCTKNALEFVTELTLQTLSNHRVYSDVFAAVNNHSTEHISLPDWADAMVIAPATADVLGKMAHGIADDALTTTFAAMRKPVVIAPAMNDKMYLNPPTQQSMDTLRHMSHVTMLDCAEGFLACGSIGKGRMQEIDTVVAALEYALTPHVLEGKKVLLTAGPTRECIDPVRYISNFSTGKMGYALARACLRRGAEVILISGPVSQSMSAWQPFAPLQVIQVQSAEEMYRETVQQWSSADIAILSAAVADFAPCEKADHKIKKQPGIDTMSLSLNKTPDIAAALGQNKTERQTLIGFALETDNDCANAIHKMQSKNFDAIVLNNPRNPGAGFGVDTNQVTVFSAGGAQKDLPLQTKEEVAEQILTCLFPNA